jgi:chemotaxis protein CheD
LGWVTDLLTAAASEVVVRMSELAVSGDAGHELVSVGLGSCVGVALVCRRGRACGLAHVMLPDSGGGQSDRPAKYADQAVPALVAQLGGLGVHPAALDAVLVGGAQMFADGMEIGARNERAVRAALQRARVPVTAAATGGRVGRTVRVDVATGSVTVREAGAAAVCLR